MKLNATRIRAISITTFPSWPGQREGFFSVLVEFIAKNGQRICQSVKIDKADLPRVFQAQKALMQRVEG